MKTKTIKIPKNVTVLYCNNNKILTFVSHKKIKSIKSPCFVLLSKKKSLMKISNYNNYDISRNVKKKLHIIKGLFCSLIFQFIEDSTKFVKKKLNLVGVGYKVLLNQTSFGSILHLKLGYSHSIFIKVPSEVTVISFKPTSLIIIGFCYYKVTRFASFIRSLKLPEPYRGKGVLFENETIVLKQGKKI